MIEYGLQRGVLQKFDTNNPAQRGRFFSMPKFVRDLLKRFNVPYYDKCCPDASDAETWPVRYNSGDEVYERFDGTNWVAIPDDVNLDGDVTIDGNLVVNEELDVTGPLDVAGVVTVSTDGIRNGADIFAGFYPSGVQQALSGAGAINVTSYHTAWTTTGANAGTLANGTVAGQLKKITMVVDAGDGTLTPTSLSGGTTITFNDAGDFVELIWNGTAWVVIQNSGATIA
jgi:hypothetical protein